MPIVNAFPVGGGGFDLAIAEDEPILFFHKTVKKESTSSGTCYIRMGTVIVSADTSFPESDPYFKVNLSLYSPSTSYVTLNNLEYFYFMCQIDAQWYDGVQQSYRDLNTNTLYCVKKNSFDSNTYIFDLYNANDLNTILYNGTKVQKSSSSSRNKWDIASMKLLRI
jgi:hypothetical protein